MVEGFGKLIKLLMLVANFIIFVSGILVLTLGILILTDKPFVDLLGTNRYIASASILIAVGSIITIISFIGALGAYKEIKCLLITFFVILLMIFLLILAGAVFAYVFRNEMDERMQSEMFNSMHLFGVDKKITDSWNSVQKNFNCCGVAINTNSASNVQTQTHLSWQINKLFQSPNSLAVPLSCCRDPEDEKSCLEKFPNSIYQNVDCYEKIKDYLRENAILLAAVATVISVLILFGMAFSSALCCMIKN